MNVHWNIIWRVILDTVAVAGVILAGILIDRRVLTHVYQGFL
jgi:hypothetical protein